MIITKQEAVKRRFPEGTVCGFHLVHPDQNAMMDNCSDCLYVRDPCGCGPDEGCEKCEIVEVQRFYCDECGNVYCGDGECPGCWPSKTKLKVEKNNE